MSIESKITVEFKKAVNELYSMEIPDQQIQIQKTRKEFSGDLTIVVFPVLRFSKKSPEDTGKEIGTYLQENIDDVNGYNVIKGFLNLEIASNYWINQLNIISSNEQFGFQKENSTGKTIMVEYSSPNTNKPLHLGHIRNNLLGYSISEILKACGHNVKKVNLVNDRGIHICKSMLAWQKWGDGKTPESENIKGDKLVGNYYVRFDQEYKKEIKQLIEQGKTEEEAKKEAPLLIEAQEMLRKWEADDIETVELWKTMNGWVYKGFDITYKELGVDFDQIYYESETYKLGKEIVLEGLEKGILFKKEDGSIWADLTEDGLDEKLLLRADGTSVYMTQDIGTAHQRFSEYNIDQHAYVVGNEQIYHFQVLSLILKKLGYNWADNIYHMSYGMVELPEGKMKSREGTVVDADDLMAEMVNTSREMSKELGKLGALTEEEKETTYKTIGLGALKYFILKVDPRKTMLFNPRESIDFNGNTGSFIQYTYARIQSILRKANENGINIGENYKGEVAPVEKEIELIKHIDGFTKAIEEAGKNFSPALVANYMFELVKVFNQFYHEYTILKEENSAIREFRLHISRECGKVIKNAMALLGANVPERM